MLDTLIDGLAGRVQHAQMAGPTQCGRNPTTRPDGPMCLARECSGSGVPGPLIPSVRRGSPTCPKTTSRSDSPGVHGQLRVLLPFVSSIEEARAGVLCPC